VRCCRAAAPTVWTAWVRLLERLYRGFTVGELREMSAGKGPHMEPLPDGERRRASWTLVELRSLDVPGPAPWRELHAALARAHGVGRDRTSASMTPTYER